MLIYLFAVIRKFLKNIYIKFETPLETMYTPFGKILQYFDLNTIPLIIDVHTYKMVVQTSLFTIYYMFSMWIAPRMLFFCLDKRTRKEVNRLRLVLWKHSMEVYCKNNPGTRKAQWWEQSMKKCSKNKDFRKKFFKKYGPREFRTDLNELRLGDYLRSKFMLLLIYFQNNPYLLYLICFIIILLFLGLVHYYFLKWKNN